MVAIDSPLKLLIKVPVPEPSVVWLNEIVGFWEVLQHTPRAVTAEPPSEVTLPPLVAVDWVMPVAAVVVTVGTTGLASVEKVKSLP